jgi:hypothetical protein
VALASAFLALGAATAKAETPGPADNTLEIRVINNHASVVHVYVEDANGRMRSLGRVGRSDFKIMEVDKSIADMGAFKIKVFPDEPAWSLLGAPDGVRTYPLDLTLGDAVNFWVETAMVDSHLEVIKG